MSTAGVAVVTGAGRGIGRSAALALAARGLDVTLLARTAEEIEAVAGEVVARGRRALAIRCDVTSSADVRRAEERTAAELGTPRVVVANAGVVHRAPVHEMSDE